MSPPILFGMGATKTGTSWLYKYLHDRDDCALKAVKELHYWDTFAGGARGKQLDALDARAARLERLRDAAEAERRGWQVRNLDRQIAEMAALRAVLAGDRAGDRAYLDYLRDGSEGRLVADITPNYALLDTATLARMAAAAGETARFVFLMRDPVDRLWSHVRMQAQRQRQPGEEVDVKAGRILNRVVARGLERHIPARGDYPAIVGRLRAAVPREQLFLGFAEDLFSGDGMADLCRFLGIDAHPASVALVHEGVKIPLTSAQRSAAARFLASQYDWVEREVATLPTQWQRNRTTAGAAVDGSREA